MTADNPALVSSGPVYDSLFADASKSPLSPAGGSVFFENGFSKVVSYSFTPLTGVVVLLV